MQKSKQLFCFTYAGGNASFFDEIEHDLPEFDFVKCEYSGHGNRHREPLYQSFDELADDMIRIFREHYNGGEYALFGYSMGCITLVEVLKRLMDMKTQPLPGHVFVAAHEPLTRKEYPDNGAEYTDAWVKERTIKFGALPERLLNNNSFWRMYLPLYRADYSIIGKYRFEDLDLISRIPATVFYSETDTPLADMKLWEKIFIADCAFRQFEGSHFFIQQHHEEMAGEIRSRMIRRED